MDRRMYRGNMGNRNTSSHRPHDSVCNDIAGGYTSEDMCERDDYEGDFDRFPIGMCYVPWQRFRNLYESEFTAFEHATLFKELDLDFFGRSCK